MSRHAARNLSAALGAGADVRCASTLAGAAVAYLLALRAARRADGQPAHPIPPGGSSALGTLGGVECALEIARQVAAGALPPPRFVYTAAGTCGTAAGLALGLALGQRFAPTLQRPRVRAVRVVPAIVASQARIRGLARGTARLLAGHGAGPLPAPGEIEVVTDQLGRGYGRPTEAGARALALAAEHGLALEPTYTAKTVAAMLARAERERDEVHLYVHTLSGADLSQPIADAERERRRPIGCDPRRLAPALVPAPT
jgi:D-cysteine desulfhydrase